MKISGRCQISFKGLSLSVKGHREILPSIMGSEIIFSNDMLNHNLKIGRPTFKVPGCPPCATTRIFSTLNLLNLMIHMWFVKLAEHCWGLWHICIWWKGHTKIVWFRRQEFSTICEKNSKTVGYANQMGANVNFCHLLLLNIKKLWICLCGMSK